MALFTYFDCESDAGAAQKATCLSVAAVTVDENFKIIDPNPKNVKEYITKKMRK